MRLCCVEIVSILGLPCSPHKRAMRSELKLLTVLTVRLPWNSHNAAGSSWFLPSSAAHSIAGSRNAPHGFGDKL